MLASGNDATFALEPRAPRATLTALRRYPRGSQPSAWRAAPIEGRAGDLAARLDAAHGQIARLPAPAARSLWRSPELARTYRLITIAPGDLAACLDAGAWCAPSFMALRNWRSGDGLMFHVKQVGRLRALAIVTGDPCMAAGQAWQVGFRVIARLADGVDTREALAPLRRGRSPRWFRGFVGTHHVIKPDDAAALLEAFEAALLASV